MKKKILCSLLSASVLCSSCCNAHAFDYYHSLKEGIDLEESFYKEPSLLEMLEDAAKHYDEDEELRNSDFGKIVAFYISAKNGIREEEFKPYFDKIDGIHDRESAIEVFKSIQADFNAFKMFGNDGGYHVAVEFLYEAEREAKEKGLKAKEGLENPTLLRKILKEIFNEDKFEFADGKEVLFESLFENENLDILKSALKEYITYEANNFAGNAGCPSLLLDELERTFGFEFYETIYNEKLKRNPELANLMKQLPGIFQEVKNLYIEKINSLSWLDEETKGKMVEYLEKHLKFQETSESECEANWKKYLPEDYFISKNEYTKDSIVKNCITNNNRFMKLATADFGEKARWKFLFVPSYCGDRSGGLANFSKTHIYADNASMMNDKGDSAILFSLGHVNECLKIAKLMDNENYIENFKLLIIRTMAHEMGHTLDTLFGSDRNQKDRGLSEEEDFLTEESNKCVANAEEKERMVKLKDKLKSQMETHYGISLENADEAFADLCGAEITKDYAQKHGMGLDKFFATIVYSNLVESKEVDYKSHPTSVARVNGILYNIDEFYDYLKEIGHYNEGDKEFIKEEDRVRVFS